MTRLIAFYLPQFHPIPENDEWWGKGFTEWTNVAKAKPLFRGHRQPKIPADLGFYDLRVPETRIAQAELAKDHGLEGFAYWHYWFGDGRRILERPFEEMISSGEPDFPFCISWANESWSGIWHGAPERILIEQHYPGDEDYRDHFYSVLPAFLDGRYITVENKPLVIVFKPENLPEPRRFTDIWRELAQREGLQGLYFVGTQSPKWLAQQSGFDGSTISNPAYGKYALLTRMRLSRTLKNRISVRLTGESYFDIQRRFMSRPMILPFAEWMEVALPDISPERDQYPCVVSNWDNTPRSGTEGYILKDANPGLFRKHLSDAIAQVSGYPSEKQLVFVKSWNEWAEGNYLEPDSDYGLEYLEVIKETLAAQRRQLGKQKS